MSDEKNRGLKTAYELALERMAGDGIAAPDRDALSEETREAIAEARRRAEARLAELEIEFHKRRETIADPAELAKAEQEYRIDCQRVDERREAEVAKLRDAG